MCIIKITKYSLCPAAHSESVVLYQHANAIYCSDQEILEDNIEGKCKACKEKEESTAVPEAEKDGSGGEDGERRDSAVDCS